MEEKETNTFEDTTVGDNGPERIAACEARIERLEKQVLELVRLLTIPSEKHPLAAAHLTAR